METPGPLACTLVLHAQVATRFCVHSPFPGTPNKPEHVLCPTLGQPRPTEKSGRALANEAGMGAGKHLTRDSTEPQEVINCPAYQSAMWTLTAHGCSRGPEGGSQRRELGFIQA